MRTRTLLEDHINSEKRLRAEMKKCIEDNSCRFQDGLIVAELRDKNIQQNGSLKRLAEQGDDTARKINKILNIAEGRKSMWKEVAIIVGIISAGAAVASFFI